MRLPRGYSGCQPQHAHVHDTPCIRARCGCTCQAIVRTTSLLFTLVLIYTILHSLSHEGSLLRCSVVAQLLQCTGARERGSEGVIHESIHTCICTLHMHRENSCNAVSLSSPLLSKHTSLAACLVHAAVTAARSLWPAHPHHEMCSSKYGNSAIGGSAGHQLDARVVLGFRPSRPL
jgi:hypothetical protein